MKNIAIVALTGLLLVIGFQNCGKKDSTVGELNSASGGTTTTTLSPVRNQFVVLKEYKHKTTGKYFFTSRASDQAAVEATGNFDIKGSIKLYSATNSSAMPLIRYWSVGTSSHFYTPVQAEIDGLNAMPSDYSNEGTEGYAVLALGERPNQSCPFGTVAVYRFWSGLISPVTARTHRFTSSSTIRQNLIAAGWTDEGIGFCALEANTIN